MVFFVVIGMMLVMCIVLGVVINIGFGGFNCYLVGEILEEKGYFDMVKQYWVFDGQVMLVDVVFGGVFGGVYYLVL